MVILDKLANSPSHDTQPDTQQGEVILKGYLRVRNGHYYYRRRVPVALYPKYFKGREISKALHISVDSAEHYKKARLSAKDWDFKVDKVFLICRLKYLTEEHKLEVIKSEVYPSREKEIPSEAKSVRLNDIFKTYIDKNQINWVPKTLTAVLYSLDLAIKVIGNPLVAELTPKMFEDYLKILLRLPANFTKSPKYRDKSIKQILNLLLKPIPQSTKSVIKHMDFLGSGLGSAKLRYLLDGLVLPKLTNRANNERIEYEFEDLQKVLNFLTWDKDRPERFWTPLVGMLQGWREDEICQIRADEVFKVEDTWCVKVRFKKNDDNYHRTLPMHPILVELGLPNYAVRTAKSHIQLFPNLKESKGSFANAFQKWYSRFNRQHITTHKQRVFHSLRHNFITWLNNETETKEHFIQFMVGHSMSKSITTKIYTKDPKPQQLLEVLDRLYHDRLDWTHIKKEAIKTS